MKIVMYTKKGCWWNDGVRDLLNEKNLPFEEREVRFNPKYFDELVKVSGQDLTPTLLIDDDMLIDSDREEVEEYLKKKGVSGF